MYGLTEQDRRIRDTARAFVETLMPHEVEAELADGVLPKEITAEHHARAIELGLYGTHAGVGRRAGLHRPAAGAGAGTVWPGDQRTGLGDGHPAAVVG